MKKSKIKSKSEGADLKNPVAKFAFQFNKAQAFGDKSKYKRKFKHGRQEDFPVVFFQRIIWKSSCFLTKEGGIITAENTKF